MNSFRKISLLLALWLLMLHNAVPHLHHQAREWVCDNEIVASVSPMDWLGEFFHFNPGNDHLEHYRTASEISNIGTVHLAPLAWINTAFELPKHSSSKQLSATVFLSKKEKEVLNRTEPDRGPPALTV